MLKVLGENYYVDLDKIDEYLELNGLVRVETNWAGVIWGDAFYIRKELLNDNIL